MIYSLKDIISKIASCFIRKESWEQDSKERKKVVDRSNKPGLNTISRDENGLVSLAPVTGMFTRLKKLDQCL